MHASGLKRLSSGLLIFAFTAFVPAAIQAGPIAGFVSADGYNFLNFNAPNAGNMAGTGTNSNGIANSPSEVGFAIDNNGNFDNFVRSANGTFTPLTLSSNTSMAFGINSAGTVVGQDLGAAFVMPLGGSPQMLNTGAGSTAFGINDTGDIVGQESVAGAMPGFLLLNGSSSIDRINAPSGPNTVNAQGIADNGTIVGFYVGNDGQDHGFTTKVSSVSSGTVTGTPVADPTIPNVPGEPGATFVFSQILGINDNGVAVGYYGDSTTSQHGFLYNVNTGVYTFLDDPSEAFDNGVEVTQITGITNTGLITGFYSDANGVFHGFIACPAGISCTTGNSFVTPEPRPILLSGLGLLVVGFWRRGRRVRS